MKTATDAAAAFPPSQFQTTRDTKGHKETIQNTRFFAISHHVWHLPGIPGAPERAIYAGRTAFGLQAQAAPCRMRVHGFQKIVRTFCGPVAGFAALRARLPPAQSVWARQDVAPPGPATPSFRNPLHGGGVMQKACACAIGWLWGMGIALGAGGQPPTALCREAGLFRENLAETVAWAVIMEQDGGLSATENHFPPEWIRVGFPCPGFALPGDLVWEFRRCEWIGALKDVLWINVRTAQVLWWWRKGPVPEVFACPRSVPGDFGESGTPVRFAGFPVGANDLLRKTHVSGAVFPRHGFEDPDQDGAGLPESSGNAGGRRRTYWTEEPSSHPGNGKLAIPRAMALERIFKVAGIPKLAEENDVVWDAKLTQAGKAEPGFCAAHDLLWDVRLVHPGEDGIPVIRGEYLVHAQTGAAFCIIAPENFGGDHALTDSVSLAGPPESSQTP